MNKLEIISVNYNTPDLIDQLIKSILSIEGNYPIRIIDGSDREPYKSEIINICNNYSNVKLEQQGWNIHHARGMDLALKTSSYEWCLIIDSDNYVKSPLIKKMMQIIENDNQIKIMGRNIEDYNRNNVYYKYYHPSYLLFNTEYYKELLTRNVSFVHDGAPCYKIMRYLFDNDISNVVGADLFEKLNISKNEISSYINMINRGTANRFGYNLK